MASERLTGGVGDTSVIQGGGFPHGESSDLTNLASLRDPQIRARIPDLSTALDVWLRTGDLSLLQSRCFLMPRGHLAPVFVLNVYGFMNEVLLPNGQKRPFMIVNHEPSFSAGENAEVLAKQAEAICQTLGINQLPQVFKTVTLEYRKNDRRYIVLVSGIGNFQLVSGTKKDIAQELELTGIRSWKTYINPDEFDTTLSLGLQPGIVKPILEPHLVNNVHGICYLKGRAKPEDIVAVSVSHIDSMIMQVRDFEFLFGDYAEATYRGFDLTRTQGYDFYRNKGLDKYPSSSPQTS